MVEKTAEDELIENKDMISETEQTSAENKTKPQTRETKSKYKEKKCTVISYNHIKKTLDIRFEQFGIRLNNVEDFSGDTVQVKYKGEIGKPDFECRL